MKGERILHGAVALAALAGCLPAIAAPQLVVGLTGEYIFQAFFPPPPRQVWTTRVDTVAGIVAAEVHPACPAYPGCVYVYPSFDPDLGAGDLRGSEVYVPGIPPSGFENSFITIVDTASDSITGTIAMGTLHPGRMVVDPTRARLYAVVNPGPQVAIIDIRSRQLVTTIGIPGAPSQASVQRPIVAPDGSRLYLVIGTTLASVSLPDGTDVTTTQLNFTPSGLALNADRQELYLSDWANGFGVVVFSTTNLQPVRNLTRFFTRLLGVTVRRSDNALLLEVDDGDGYRANRLVAIDSQTGDVLAMSSPPAFGAVLSLDGSEVYRFRRGTDCPDPLAQDYSCTSVRAVVLDGSSLQEKGEIILDTRAAADPRRKDTAVVAAFAVAVPTVSRAVEYFDATRGHYFVTSLPAEIAALDGGAFPGWQRTGETLPVYAKRADGPDSTVPVCRFYGLPAKGLDSHFYSASAAECAAVQQKFGDAWLLESSDVFDVYPADVATGVCPFETAPAYRVYNNRADANHRYTTSLAIRDSMVQAGWIPEGYGPNAVAFCVPR